MSSDNNKTFDTLYQEFVNQILSKIPASTDSITQGLQNQIKSTLQLMTPSKFQLMMHIQQFKHVATALAQLFECNEGDLLMTLPTFHQMTVDQKFNAFQIIATKLMLQKEFIEASITGQSHWFVKLASNLICYIEYMDSNMKPEIKERSHSPAIKKSIAKNSRKTNEINNTFHTPKPKRTFQVNLVTKSSTGQRVEQEDTGQICQQLKESQEHIEQLKQEQIKVREYAEKQMKQLQQTINTFQQREQEIKNEEWVYFILDQSLRNQQFKNTRRKIEKEGKKNYLTRSPDENTKLELLKEQLTKNFRGIRIIEIISELQIMNEIPNREQWHQIYHDIVSSLRLHKLGGLMILSSGINPANIVSLLISHFLERSKSVIILLDFTPEEIEFMDHNITMFALQNKLHDNKLLCLDILKLTKLTADKRAPFYKSGGIFSISNQVFMQDLLNKNVSAFIITHIIINKAHAITSRIDYQSWIVNFVKIQKPDIFTLAISNNASLLQCKQNAQLILKFLYINQLMPWPLNRAEIVKSLKKQGMKWQHFNLTISAKVKQMQNCLMNLIEQCIQDINKKCSGAYLSSDSILKLSEQKIKAIIQRQQLKIDLTRYQFFMDIFQLKKLLYNLITQNPFQFDYNLQKIINEASIDSIWFVNHNDVEKEISELQRLSKSRVYTVVPVDQPIKYTLHEKEKELKIRIQFNINLHPKLAFLLQLLDQIKSDTHQRIWIHVKQQSTVTFLQQQLNSYYKINDKCNALAQFNYLRFNLQDHVYIENQAPVQQKKPVVILKHNKKIINKQDNSKELDVSYLKEILKLELQDYFNDILEQKEQHLLQQAFVPKRTQYQLLPQELLQVNIQNSGERLNSEGEFVSFDEDSQLPNCSIVINAIDNDCQRLRFRETFIPDHIIIYEPNHNFLKELMVTECQAKVYLILQEDTIESWAYHKEKLDEEQAFEYLIGEQENYVRNVENPEEAIQRLSVQASSRQGKGEAFFDQKQNNPIVIVDYREFRSEIPPKLYYSGFNIVPVMLKVGDIIVSNNCGIERKCVETGDFFESITNKRLEEQLRKMNQFEFPFILIEFSENIGFCLSSLYRSSGQSHNTKILIKLLELVQKYQKIQILWSKNCDETVKIIKRLKEGVGKNTPEVSLFRNTAIKEAQLQNETITNYFSQLDQIII